MKINIIKTLPFSHSTCCGTCNPCTRAEMVTLLLSFTNKQNELIQQEIKNYETYIKDFTEISTHAIYEKINNGDAFSTLVVQPVHGVDTLFHF